MMKHAHGHMLGFCRPIQRFSQAGDIWRSLSLLPSSLMLHCYGQTGIAMSLLLSISGAQSSQGR